MVLQSEIMLLGLFYDN